MISRLRDNKFLVRQFSLEGKSFKIIIAREIIILLSIIVITYFVEVVFMIFNRGPSGPVLPFWKDKYAFEFWNNSLRENAKIVRFLGYPFFLMIRLVCWTMRLPEVREVQKAQDRCCEIEKMLQKIVDEIRLRRLVVKVIYRPDNHWYVIRFEDPPSCIIPQRHIDDYISSNGQRGKEEIVNSLLSRQQDTY